MFSGGLDSLAGAVQRASEHKNLVLISHRPNTIQDNRQRNLVAAIKKRLQVPIIHVPVCINKDDATNREYTQRTRSFLYAALGAIIGDSVRADGVSFFENGIVSLNLPVADETLRARATRTTHPIAIARFTEFFSAVLERQFTFDNPFVFMTKAEVISVIANHGHGELIQQTCSCAHQGIWSSGTQYHCGGCSQCIDRRVGVFEAGLEKFDPGTDYRTDVFVGRRKDGYERNMAVNYARHGIELSLTEMPQMAARYNNEFCRAARPFSKRSEVAQKFAEMHQRHGKAVARVLERQVARHAAEFVNGTLCESSLLALVAGNKHKESSWFRFADRITGLLQNGLPISCRSEKPKNEPHLQELCDGILKSNDQDLLREYPFLRWCSVMTKPDWSAEEFQLWVELKYVRDKKDILPISEAVSSDITKYGDNKRRTLFLVYDPSHLVTDEAAWRTQVESHDGMRIRFVR